MPCHACLQQHHQHHHHTRSAAASAEPEVEVEVGAEAGAEPEVEAEAEAGTDAAAEEEPAGGEPEPEPPSKERFYGREQAQRELLTGGKIAPYGRAPEFGREPSELNPVAGALGTGGVVHRDTRWLIDLIHGHQARKRAVDVYVVKDLRTKKCCSRRKVAWSADSFEHTARTSKTQTAVPLVNLEQLRAHMWLQMKIRGETTDCFVWILFQLLAVYVFSQQLQVHSLFLSSFAMQDLFQNTGSGAGMDQLSLATISTERDIFNYLRTTVVPNIQNTEWYTDAAAPDRTIREDCTASGFQKEDHIGAHETCTQSWVPLQNENRSGYGLPWDEQKFLRKYNMLIGGIQIGQHRGRVLKCPARGFIDLASGFEVYDLDEEIAAPAYKCFSEYDGFYLGNGSASSHDYVYPRRHAEQAAAFKNLYDAGGYITGVNDVAGRFGGLLNAPDIEKRAEAFLTDCLAGNETVVGNSSAASWDEEAGATSCMCDRGLGQTSVLMDLYDGTDMHSTAAGIAAGLFNTSHPDPATADPALPSAVRAECYDAALAFLSDRLRKPFLMKDWKTNMREEKPFIYSAYIDPKGGVEQSKAMLDFLEQHAWIDELTREVVVSFVTNNPSTDAVTKTRLRCLLDKGGTVKCESRIISTHVNLYHSWDFASKIRLGLECLLVLGACVQIIGEIFAIIGYRADQGIVVRYDRHPKFKFVYTVRMGSTTEHNEIDASCPNQKLPQALLHATKTAKAKRMLLIGEDLGSITSTVAAMKDDDPYKWLVAPDGVKVTDKEIDAFIEAVQMETFGKLAQICQEGHKVSPCSKYGLPTPA